MKKNKLIFVLMLTLLIVIVLGIILFPKLKTGYMGKTIKVITLKKDIPPRSLITDDLIKETSMPEEFIDTSRVLTNKEDVVNKYSTTEILTTDFLTKEKLTNENNQALYESSKLIAVTMPTLSSSVGGILTAGDKVNIYGYKEGTEKGAKVIYEDLKKIEVAYVLNSQGRLVEEAKESDATLGIPSVIVFKVETDKQVQELLNLEFETKIHLERVS